MKKTFIFIVLTLLVLSAVGCSSDTASNDTVIKVGATPVPHSELLEQVKEELESQNITLEIVEFTDYVKPNLALADEEIDANFFQHVPYLDNFNEEHNLSLVSVGSVHVEPLGLYSESLTSIDALQKGATIAIPADSVNGGRGLLLLQAHGLITLSKDAGLEATEEDVIENPKNLKFTPIEAAQIPRILVDVDAGIINGNYALEANLNPVDDSLILEGSESPYANILVTREDNQEREAIKALVKALQSQSIKDYILNNYNGGVVPAF